MSPKKQGRKSARRRAIGNMNGEREFEIHDGSCTIGICGEEAACKELQNNTYTCVCPHDSKPPTLSGTCLRKIVPVDPGRIPNVQPPSNKPSINSTSRKLPAQSISPENLASSNYVFFIIAGSAICLLVIVLIICLVKKFKCRHANQGSSPINLKQSLLVPDRYTPNPQYSACTATGVPLLRKETLKFLNVIGEGCFGKVYKGELTTEGEKILFVAIKVLKENATRENEDDFIREVEIMSAFKHPNILCLLGMVTNDGTATSPMMVFEFMPHGDLAELLRSQRDPYGEMNLPKLEHKHLLSIALQIANGMRYLAAQRFVHRDLASRNCLVTQGPVVKIADFGMSRDVYTSDYYRIGGSRLLPVRWMSPESVLYGRFTLESDVWSYGVVLWEIYSYGKQPYYGHTNDEAVRLIIDGIMLIPPDDCPSLICELMKNCWKTEARDRIKFPNICDKLELAHENSSGEIRNDDNDTSVHFEDEIVLMKKSKTLPRPPPLPLPSSSLQSVDDLSDLLLLDKQGYLLANNVTEPVQYLRTLP